jgi:dTDP-4-dehydrorhamnose 3,5-epimerase
MTSSPTTLRVEKCALPEVLLITQQVFADDRGFFLETYSERDFAAVGITARFVQDNQSRSKRGALRGLHYQLEHPQGKLVRVTRGKIFDVAADIRAGSPTFGKWVGVVLDDDKKQALLIPAGFAHGFCVLSDVADVAYKATDFYAPSGERGVRWDDPLLGIRWPIEDPILSEKDRTYPLISLGSADLPKY